MKNNILILSILFSFFILSLKVNAQTSFSNPYIPNSHSIDKTKSVGEIPISSSVAPNGAMTYNVPLNIVPGKQNFQPQLALVYNHLGGNGIMGTGWNIAGLSMISRTVKNFYYDGKPEGINMTKSDALILDGMRLIKISETSSQIKYQSEQGYIKVNAVLSGDIIKYFEVFYPNGCKGIFGYTTNSVSKLHYPLTNMSDLHGNTISYSYTYSSTSNCYKISRILYNSSASIDFTYTSRQDVGIFYETGITMKIDQLLTQITCKFLNNLYHQYSLVYKTQQYVSLLSEVQYSAPGLSFNPLRFFYGQNNQLNNYMLYSEIGFPGWHEERDFTKLRVSRGKFEYGTDNDGLISLTNKNPYINKGDRYENQYDGTEKISFHSGLHTKYKASYINTEPGFIDIFTANIDGKSEEEVIKVNNVISGINEQIIFKVYRGNTLSNVVHNYTRTFTVPTMLTDVRGNRIIHPKFYHAGDFNGDGKMEVFAISCYAPKGDKNTKSNSYLFDLEGNKILYSRELFDYKVDFNGANTDRLLIFDYDGDGKSDICVIGDNATTIYTFNTSGSAYILKQVATFSGLKKADLAGRNLTVGEFNGDGKPDLILSPKVNNSDWFIFYGKGNGQFDKISATLGTRVEGTRSFVVQDVNKDGLTDVIDYTSSGFNTYLALSGWGRFRPPIYCAFHDKKFIAIPVNMDAPSSSVVVAGISSRGIARFTYSRDDYQEKLLTGVINSFGVISKNHYQKLSTSSYYTKGSGAVFPYFNFSGSLLVPVALEQYLNGKKVESFTYRYNNALIHLQGLGFRGFTKITVNDNIRSRTSSTTYDPEKHGIVTEEESPLVKNVNTYSYTVSSKKIVNINLTKRLSFDKSIWNKLTTYTYQYDTYGNPTKEMIEYDNKVYRAIAKSFSNNVSEASYLLGLVTQENHGILRNGSSWYKRVNYGGFNKGLPTTKECYVNNNRVSSETLSYDAAGNVTKQILTDGASKTFTSTYQYDTYGRLISETDPMNLSTTYNYSYTSGISCQSVKKTDHKGNVTVQNFDALGRTVAISLHQGIVESTGYQWTSYGTGALHQKRRARYDGYVTIVSYDALNRECRTMEIRADGKYTKVEKQYDTYGRLSKVSMPFTGDTPSQWNTYSYDTYDRLIRVSEFSTGQTTYSYDHYTISTGISGPSVSTTKDGITTTKRFDHLGNLIFSSDPGGVITYNLRPDGQPISIVAPGNVTTHFEYDKYGRQTAIIDPSAGTQRYEYDGAGNIVKTTDADGRVTQMSYDRYNRLTSEVTPEMSSQYTYNTDGLLISITASNGTLKYFYYDRFGRITTESEQSASLKSLTKSYTYCFENGLIETIAYRASGEDVATEKYIYSFGSLSEVKANDISIWKLNSQNDWGQPISIYSGSLQNTYTYDSYGLPSGKKVTIGSRTIADYSYSFDRYKQNLTSRRDNKHNVQETFKYDNLDRLVQYGKVGTVLNNVFYDNKGNIVSRGDVADYFYDIPEKPYAISGADNRFNSENIPERNQTITYTSFKRPSTMVEGQYTAQLMYNPGKERTKMEITKNGVKELTRYYMGGNYERDEQAGKTVQKLYVGGDYYTAPAVYVKQNSEAWQLYYIGRDYLGSITQITDRSGNLVAEYSYDAWGRLRKPQDLECYRPDTEPSLFLGRGYTGHEHLTMFGLVNMNARLYDPAVGRFLSPDPYVQAPDFSQNFNRYSYCLNNPLKYTDPSGEFWWIPMVIGAVIGTYIGGAIANESLNPTKWDWSSGKTWGFMLGGAIVGGAAGYMGGLIAGSGIPMANTFGIANASFINSVGTALYSGQNNLSVSFGVVSYNFTKGSVGFLGKKGNSALDNIGYGLGALANVGDMLSIADNFLRVEDRIAQKANDLADSYESQGHIRNSDIDATMGRNLNGTSYMGHKNPMISKDNFYYGRVNNWGYKEYPSYLHDIDYIGFLKPRQSGALALFTSNKTWVADVNLAARQLYLSSKHFNIGQMNVGGFLYGVGMGTIAAYKSPLNIFKLFGRTW